MQDIEIFGNKQKGLEFIKQTEQKKFIFSLVISYTATSEIPGITIAGEHPDLIKFTGPADAEFIHYGHCKSISVIPMTPDGKPTPALLTKTALEAASISSIVINAGSKVSPKLPFIDMNLDYGRNIGKEPALSIGEVGKAVEYGRIIGRFLGASTDCLVVGESIPGGTTTALGVLEGLGIKGLVSSSMPENLVLIVAMRNGRSIAASLNIHNGRRLCGRYWGALEHHPSLHFEACYYQVIEFCIAHGIATFEGGAQGEHKIARGLMPVQTHSAHWLAHPQFAAAIEDFLARETRGVAIYLDELNERTPFRQARAPAGQ